MPLQKKGSATPKAHITQNQTSFRNNHGFNFATLLTNSAQNQLNQQYNSSITSPTNALEQDMHSLSNIVNAYPLNASHKSLNEELYNSKRHLKTIDEKTGGLQ